MRQAIAILDSGVGGLTVVKEVRRQIPGEQIIYFGDTARAPYGPRPASEVLFFTRQIVDFLVQFNPKLLVLACNTATAAALQPISASVSMPVVGVIRPGARAAVRLSAGGSVGVIGTEGTINSGAYEQALREMDPGVRVVSLACPRFVPLVENGLFETAEARAVVEQSLQPIRAAGIDSLILGCTHYPFLSGPISDVMGRHVQLISSADETAREIRDVLERRGQLDDSDDYPQHQFYCSGDPDVFRRIGEKWLGEPLDVQQAAWPIPHTI